MSERSIKPMQALVDSLPDAQRYCTDAFNVYDEMIWPEQSTHITSIGKEETHTIESVNANLRTYLGRLARRSRCFTRSLEALRCAVRLFVFHYNRRQRFRLARPWYRNALPLLF
jgi:IS1 family transposase